MNEIVSVQLAQIVLSETIVSKIPYVSGISENGPAAKAGLQAGDVIRTGTRPCVFYISRQGRDFLESLEDSKPTG